MKLKNGNISRYEYEYGHIINNQCGQCGLEMSSEKIFPKRTYLQKKRQKKSIGPKLGPFLFCAWAYFGSNKIYLKTARSMWVQTSSFLPFCLSATVLCNYRKSTNRRTDMDSSDCLRIYPADGHTDNIKGLTGISGHVDYDSTFTRDDTAD